jgi:NitT/TauT family transport system substrate-binding protein
MTKVVNEISSPVFSLPWLVARQEGLFEQEGLDIEFVNARPQEGYRLAEDPEAVPSIAHHRPFEEGQAAIYRACEWGQIRRSYDSARGGRIAGKRSAIGIQALFSAAGSPFTHPQTLRNQRIGVIFHTGMHYAALQMLEGFLKRDEIKVVHFTNAREAYEAITSGEVAASSIMEPWITIAEKQGLQKIIETHYVGSEIASPELDASTWEKIVRVLKRAVGLINADKRKYLHHLIDPLPPQYRSLITPDDFHLPRLRYVDPAPYTREEFEQTREWLVGWGLVRNDAAFDDLVKNKIPSVAA